MPPDERRSMIVRATLPLLLEHGEMVTTRQIADAAGIAEGTIFRAFPDKDALITAVVEAAFDTEVLDRALQGIDPDLPFDAALLAAVEIIQRRLVDLWRIASSIGPKFHEATRRNLTISEPLLALFAAHRERLTVEPAEAARLVRAITLAVTHPSLVEEPMAPDRVVDLFLHGVGRQGATC
jgi:AcrR family transcriptional regulator